MLLALRLQEYLTDHPFLIDNKGRSMQPHILAAIKLFLSPYAVFVDDNMFRIGDKRKGQIKFCFKLFMALLIIGTDPDDGKSLLFEQRDIIPEITGLDRTCRCIVLRIEIEHQLFSFVVGKRDLLSIGILPGKSRGLVSFLQMGHDMFGLYPLTDEMIFLYRP